MRFTLVRSFTLTALSWSAQALAADAAEPSVLERGVVLTLVLFADLMVLPTVVGAFVLSFGRWRTRLPLMLPGAAALVVGLAGLTWAAFPHAYRDDTLMHVGVPNALLAALGAAVVFRARRGAGR